LGGPIGCPGIVRITILRIMIPNIMALSVMTFSIMPLSIITLNKLVLVFVPGKLYQTSLIFAGKSGAYPSEVPRRYSLLG
jgi:hypothetical protein